MTDPLSISAGILAILQITEKVVKYGFEFAGAIKEIRDLKEEFESLHSVLVRLMERCENAQKSHPDEPPPWLRGLWEVRGGKFDKNGVWVFEYRGMVAQLKQAIEEAATKLNPSREWQKSEAYQRASWHHRKDTFSEIRTTVSRCFNAINTILALNNDETLNETLELMKESSQYTKDQLGDISSRLSMFELKQKREEDRRRRDEEEAEREEIAEWLSPLSFIAKQDELWTNSFKEVGDWLWQDERFRAWTDGRSWHLHCVGALGVGKTVLSSVLTHHLPEESQQRQPPILSLYLNHKSSNVQTLPHLLGSLLKQLIQIDETFIISDDLRTVYKKAKRLKLEPISYFKDMLKILSSRLASYDRFYIIVDGLDELPPRNRRPLLGELLKLRSTKGSLVITTRPVGEQTGTGVYKCNICFKEFKLAFRCRICDKGNYDICYECKQKGLWCRDRLHTLTEPYGQVEIELEIPSADIERYVWSEVQAETENLKSELIDDQDPNVLELIDDRDPNVLDNPITTAFQDLIKNHKELQNRIVAEVTQKANGRFLYARLYMDSLKTKKNLVMLKKTLRTFPDSIDDIYKEGMQRIQAQEPDERKRAYRVLGMITRTRRPLGLHELQHALAALYLQGEEDMTENDIVDAIDQPKTILDSTSALVILEEDETQVRLVHRSLEDYLHIEENTKKWFPNAEIEIANACMTYLEFVLPRKRCNDDYYITKKLKFPFLQYASQYWGDHVRNANYYSASTADVQQAALRLMNNPQHLEACMQAAWCTNPGGHDTWDVWRGIDRLHVCAWYGLSSVLSAMDVDKSLVDRVEPKYGQTPLMYACRKGHSDVVRQLLRLGASQQKTSARGRNALFEAILGHHSSHKISFSETHSKHGEVVDILVCEMSQDLDINMTHSQERDRTALILAANLGHLEMIETLLKHQDVKLDLQDQNGMTALYLAAREDHYEVVRVLLDAGASIDIVDFHAGRSPLRCAAERDLDEMVDLLLQYGANPELKDREGGTAALRAVNRGAKRALEKMMEYDVDLQCTDEAGQSLLHGAAWNGFHEIVRLLLDESSQEEKRLRPNIRDTYNLTPLHEAARHGKEVVVSILLERKADASLKDHSDRTPYMVAWQYGHHNIMQMLEQSNPRPQATTSLDEDGLPVWSMVRRKRTDLVSNAIQTRKGDLHIPEPCTEYSPLHVSIEENEPDILTMLLETKLLPVNRPDRSNRTPLHIAALEGDSFATKCLIDYDVKIDLKDRWNDEALFLAQSNEHLEVMLILIEAGAFVDKKRIDLKRLFFFAVEQGNVAAAQILIEKHGVDRSMQNADGVRPLQIAIAADDEDMMMLLRSASTVNFSDVAINTSGSNNVGDRRTPFLPFRSRPIQL